MQIIQDTVAGLELGAPVVHRRMAMFPLLNRKSDSALQTYVTLDEALESATAQVSAYFAEVDHRFRGCGSQISAKWNARRSVATCVGQLPPIGVVAGCRYPTRDLV